VSLQARPDPSHPGDIEQVMIAIDGLHRHGLVLPPEENDTYTEALEGIRATRFVSGWMPVGYKTETASQHSYSSSTELRESSRHILL